MAAQTTLCLVFKVNTTFRAGLSLDDANAAGPFEFSSPMVFVQGQFPMETFQINLATEYVANVLDGLSLLNPPNPDLIIQSILSWPPDLIGHRAPPPVHDKLSPET